MGVGIEAREILFHAKAAWRENPSRELVLKILDKGLIYPFALLRALPETEANNFMQGAKSVSENSACRAY